MTAALPATYRRWHLYGAGLENVGKDGRPETVALPEPGPDEILVRHDACGICFSDIKIITLGENHPRLAGRDLRRNPVVMGHEVALTVEKAGAERARAFRPGQRFIVQADVYYRGANLAYGYALAGGMSQYGLIGPEVIDGDEGCYLLPIRETTGVAEAALVEPWACVEAAYRWNDQGVEAARFETPPAPEAFEAACADLPKNATVRLDFAGPLSRPVALDIGRIHYDGHRYVSPQPNRRSELKGAGTAWFVGAAGPMGMMHVQRALSLPAPPRRLVVTDRHTHRLDALQARFGADAAAKGVELLLFNVRQSAPDWRTLAPEGFDDIIVMVPSIEAIEDAFPRLAPGGVLNVFAGVGRGTTARIDLADIVRKNVRIVGTSGSSIADMEAVRDKMEAGRLDTGASLAAIGGLDAFKEGLEAVKNSRFPGKTVIFPHVQNLPLTALPDLKTVRPAVYAKLRDGQFWTREAEAALRRG